MFRAEPMGYIDEVEENTNMFGFDLGDGLFHLAVRLVGLAHDSFFERFHFFQELLEVGCSLLVYALVSRVLVVVCGPNSFNNQTQIQETVYPSKRM